ncbi:MAG: antibiotic biosynthesis monooxygenase [Candidatus Lambdaproteobacteria bacterium]|nr:antibiotic biosynthesis monooxygenase [Candidatus Lambdaproteobacteria bacterium]
MEMVLFASRMRDMPPEDAAEYQTLLQRMLELASAAPGFISHKTYTAPDGERMTVVLFDSAENAARWANLPEHRQAQQRGRERFYAEYRVYAGPVTRSYSFSPQTGRRLEQPGPGARQDAGR